MRSRRPCRGQLRRTSNFNWSFRSNRGVGSVRRFFARPERGGRAAVQALLLRALRSIVVFTITRITAIPLPRAPIDGIFGLPASRGFIAIPLTPALFFRSLGLPVSHPGLEIFLFGRRIQILRDWYILSRRMAAMAKQASHLSRCLGKDQGIARTCQDQGFFILVQGRVLHAQNRGKLIREPRAHDYARLRFL